MPNNCSSGLNDAGYLIEAETGQARQ
jgi:hypothetical protein